MDLDQPNIGRGLHISVRELDHQDTPIGHDAFSFKNERPQVYWTRFSKGWRDARVENETQSGFPMCIYEILDTIKMEELMWIRCPSKEVNEHA